MSSQEPLAILDTHPVQYRAPVYQALAREFGVPITVIYGSDFSIAGYRDREFGAAFSWDVDLLSGTNARFLARAADGGASCFEEISARGIGRALDDAGPSAVLVTGYQPAFNLIGIIQARSRRIPVLFRAETSDVMTRSSAAPVRDFVRDSALRLLYSQCERVLPIGARSRAHYQRLGVPDHKMIFSPYCVNTAPFRPEERDREAMREAMRPELGLSASDFVILFSGKLSERKGVHTLVEAAKQFPDRLRERAVLLFLGAGSERDALEREAKAQPLVRAIFAGFRNQTELSPYYHAADVFVLPSLWGETWGLVVNEALHHGVPCVVSSAVGCGPDLIDEDRTGAVAEAGSAASLAGKIMRIEKLAGVPETRLRCREIAEAHSTSVAAAGIARAWRDIRRRTAVPEMVSRGTAA